jgi:hypothetical protein
MFLDNSRYARVDVVQVRVGGAEGASVDAVKLRRLPATGGVPVVVTDRDRLDLIAGRRYGEPTWFWHIADANTELEASGLTARPLRTILVPET